MAKITIIRHAQTECNISKTFMGVADIPLLPESIEKAKELKDHPLVVPTEVCYTSRLMRANQTARAIFDDVPIVIDPRLIERDLGEWAGMKKDAIVAKYPNAFYPSGVMDFYYTPEGGEPYRDMVLRVADFLKFIAHESRKICIVTHNGVYRVMRSLITGDPLSKVFDSFEPYLTPSEYEITDEVIAKIEQNPFYTVDEGK